MNLKADRRFPFRSTEGPPPAHPHPPTPQAPLGYTGIQIALHWAIALLILSQFLTGDWMGEFFRALMRQTADPAAARPEMGNAL